MTRWVHVPDWSPGDACPCGCGVIAAKLNRFGHAHRVCGDLELGAERICRECLGRNANARGHRKQSKVLKDAAGAVGVRMDRAPTNEEHARLGFWHIESKSGTSIPQTLRGAYVRHAEKQAQNAAEGVAAWAVVFVMPDGSRRFWCDYEAMLRYMARVEGEEGR